MSTFDGKLNSLSGYKSTNSSPSSSPPFIDKPEEQDRKEDNNNENNHTHNKEQQKEDNPKNNNGNGNNKKITIFKYTPLNQLHESIILKGTPVFVAINKNDNNNYDPSFLTEIEETTRTLIPPALEEYPSSDLSYSFESKEDLQDIILMINNQQISIDSLFFMIRKYVTKFIVHHDHILDYITALILFSYFQDKYPTVPYTMFVSDNGSGKSTIGNVFEILGYRCVNMTDPTTANVFRIFGTVESGQCTLVLDEVEKIDKDRDMMSILKTGYDNGKKVQRVNLNINKIDHYHTFGLKVMLAERTPNVSVAAGVIDRTFVIHNHKGTPELDIKEIRSPFSNHVIKQDILFLRKVLFVYRLLYHNQKLKNIETVLIGRDKELCKPILQVFYGSDAQEKIERALERLLDDKNSRKSNSLERDVLEVVVGLLEEHKNGVIPFGDIWKALINKLDGSIEHNQREIETDAYGLIYKRSVSKMLRDKFGARDPEKRKANVTLIAFESDKIRGYLQGYRKEEPTKISCSIIPSESSESSEPNECNRHILFARFVQSLGEKKNDDIKDKDKDEKDEKELSNNNNNFDDDNNNDKQEIEIKNMTSDSLTTIKDNDDNNDKENADGHSNRLTPLTTLTDLNKGNIQSGYSIDEENRFDKRNDNSGKDGHILNLDGTLQTTYENNSTISNINSSSSRSSNNDDNIFLNPMIEKKGLLYNCKQHPKVQNIHLKEIKDHLKYSKEHLQISHC